MKSLIVQYTDRLALVDDEDFERLSLFRWNFNGRSNIQRRVPTGHKSLANEVMSTVGIVYDHKDVDCFNNQKYNLRITTYQLNNANKFKRLAVGSTSKYKGVSVYRDGRFRGRLIFNRKQIHLGIFDTEIEAAKAYNKAAIEKFGEFARLNEFDLDSTTLDIRSSVVITA